MIPSHISSWAMRFVCGNDSEVVQKHIELLTDSEEETLIEAIQQVLDGMKPYGFGGRRFGHDKITEDKLPMINERGFFLRNNNSWSSFPADLEGVFQVDARLSTLTIDHVDNLFYSNGQPFLFPNRPFLRISSGFCNERTIWHAERSQLDAWTIKSANKSYVDYWDNVGGVDGKIREDFVLKESDIKEMIKAFLNEEPFAERFRSVPNFIGFHPELAMEYIDEFGE